MRRRYVAKGTQELPSEKVSLLRNRSGLSHEEIHEARQIRDYGATMARLLSACLPAAAQKQTCREVREGAKNGSKVLGERQR
jgi:hypothetical protein